MDVNRGDAFDYLVSMGNYAATYNQFAAETFEKDHPMATKKFDMTDIINTMFAVVAFSAVVLMGPFLGAAEPASERTPVIARYEAMRYGMFIHFGMTTFLEKPFCSVGILKVPLPPAKTYRPTKLDVDQWVSVAEKSGMRYVVLTVKHWLGFALWDSKFSDYDIATSGNKTDVVAEFVKACRKHGIAPCFLYTIGQDVAHRREKGMSEDQWNRHALNQVGELLTNYGPITSIWFDGMGVGDYPDARVQQAYDTVKSLQPDCLVVMHDPGQGGRWPTDVFQPGRKLPTAAGHDPRMARHGKTYYVPADVIDTVVEKWFWNPDVQPRPLADLLNGYRDVTARGANFTLNAGVNRQGKLPADQVQRLLELGKAIKETPASETGSSDVTDVLVDGEHCRGAHVTTRPHNRKVVYHVPSGTWFVFHGTGHWTEKLGDAGSEQEMIAWRASRDGETFSALAPAVLGNGHSSSTDVLLVADQIFVTETRWAFWRKKAGIPWEEDGEIWYQRGLPDRPMFYVPFEVFPFDVIDGRLVAGKAGRGAAGRQTCHPCRASLRFIDPRHEWLSVGGGARISRRQELGDVGGPHDPPG